MERVRRHMTPRNMRILWIIVTLVALAAAAGAPVGYGGGGG